MERDCTIVSNVQGYPEYVNVILVNVPKEGVLVEKLLRM